MDKGHPCHYPPFGTGTPVEGDLWFGVFMSVTSLEVQFDYFGHHPEVFRKVLDSDHLKTV